MIINEDRTVSTPIRHPGAGIGEFKQMERQADSHATEWENPECAKILIVDDEPINIKVVQKYLKMAGYQHFVTTSDSRTALELIRSELPDVILLDIMMPHVSGLEILDLVRKDQELWHLPVLILTAADDDATKQNALDLGTTDFLTKPVKPTELTARVRNAFVVKAHHDHLANYSARLEQEVQQRTLELFQSRTEVIQVLASAAEFRDQDTGNHVLRVGRYAAIIAEQLGLSDDKVQLIEQASILHDVGKIGIPDSILLKPGRLDDQEMECMKKHCDYGARIVQAGQSPILQMAATIAAGHHEKWDGNGYPNGLAGEEIPIEARITAVADVFDALNSRRPYKEPMPIERCFEILEEGRGKHFDPKVLTAFFERSEEIIQVVRNLADE